MQKSPYVHIKHVLQPSLLIFVELRFNGLKPNQQNEKIFTYQNFGLDIDFLKHNIWLNLKDEPPISTTPIFYQLNH